MSSDKICIFGSEGLLGSWVCKSAKESGFRVIAIDKLTADQTSGVNSDSYHCLDVVDAIKNNGLGSFIRGTIDIRDVVGVINCILPPFLNDFSSESVSDACLKLYGLDHILCETFVEELKQVPSAERKHCKIILTSSIKSRRPPKFWQYENTAMKSPAIYGAMKSAINYLIQDMASRYTNNNISFAGVAPGGILGENHSKQFVDNYNSSVSDGGLVPPGIIGEFIMAMIKAGPFLNGVTIDIDSGWNAVDGRRI